MEFRRWGGKDGLPGVAGTATACSCQPGLAGDRPALLSAHAGALQVPILLRVEQQTQTGPNTLKDVPSEGTFG